MEIRSVCIQSLNVDFHKSSFKAVHRERNIGAFMVSVNSSSQCCIVIYILLAVFYVSCSLHPACFVVSKTEKLNSIVRGVTNKEVVQMMWHKSRVLAIDATHPSVHLHWHNYKLIQNSGVDFQYYP